MTADITLGDFILQKYEQLVPILDNLILACSLGDCPEREVLLAGIKQQTNHSGLHLTESELAMMFLGRPTIEPEVLGG